MATDLAALVGESYERAYTDMVRVQQLAELEEVIRECLAAAAAATHTWGAGGGGAGCRHQPVVVGPLGEGKLWVGRV